jgi:hypothetical protein
MTALNRAFENLARSFLSEHPDVRHEWREVNDRFWGDRSDLICGTSTPSEVYASLLGYQIAIGLTNGDHQDFEDFGRGLADSELAQEAFECFVGLLKHHGHI